MTVTERGGWNVEERASFADAVNGAGESQLGKSDLRRLPAHIALPVRCGIFERLTFPSTDTKELSSMVTLQFEKNLPYPVEETSVGFQILSQTGTETTLLACAVHEPDLTALCSPLLEDNIPRQLTFWAMHIAAQARAGTVACGLWREEEKVVFGIFENRRLGFVEAIAGENDLCSAMPGAMLRAEIAGAPTEFAEVLLDPALAAEEEALAGLFRVPFRPIVLEGGEVAAVDLTPEKWRAERARRKRRLSLRRRILFAAVAYIAVFVTCLVYSYHQNRQLETLRKQAAALQPQVDAIIERQARWKTLAPAIDQRHFAVELLFQTWQCLPSEETRITRFELARDQIAVEGEAPDAQQAIAFAEKIKTQPELSDYRFESAPPVLLPNEHAQFRIFGKQ
ncbi:MAG: hypothetical protein PHQ12_11485 [Chthoniobacteraceae bacterium]|nr:hypothetical protein [Chthoniobacteraceae bacterium]